VSIESLSALDRSTLRERSLEALRSAILSGRYRPGVSGNPRGSLPGSRNTLRLARALAEAGIAAVVIMERPGMVRPSTARRPRRLAA